MSPRKRATKAGPTPVEALRHTDRRANIPTNELRGMLADDERAPKAMLYPRDPSLDPQLVWRGKDEQDARRPGRDGPPDLHPGEDRPEGADRESAQDGRRRRSQSRS